MSTENTLPDDQVQAIADKSTVTAVILALVLSPVAYYYVGRTKLAILNLITLNYLMLGIVAVPVHVYKIINDAEQALDGRQ
jgi:hypothetical protein